MYIYLTFKNIVNITAPFLYERWHPTQNILPLHFSLVMYWTTVTHRTSSFLCYSFISFFLAFVYLGSGDMASFLMTEARQHNTEIRMAVSKVADKMDHLMTKVMEPSHFESRGIK